MTLDGKVAIVSGANREIGAAMAVALAREGAAVLLGHYGELERAETTAEEARAAGVRAELFEANLANVAECRALVARCTQLFGRVDILAANAGITHWNSFLEADERDWAIPVDLNLKGSYFCAQAAARAMVAQGDGGRIIFTSSVTGLRAAPNGSIYGMTKAALRHLSSILAVELGEHRITVNALALGAILNDRNLAGDADYAASWSAITPNGRVGQPGDAAAALVFLASPAALHITGQTIVIDGGWTLRSPMP